MATSDVLAGLTSRQVVLRRRPQGVPVVEDFGIESVPVREPRDGEYVVRNIFASIDPAIRQRLSLEDSYVKRLDIGESINATAVSEIIASRHRDYAPGTLLIGHHTIADYSTVSPGPHTRPLDPTLSAQLTHHLSVLGATGLTAYFGLIEVGLPRAGETVLVSSAAGAVGSIVGQIAGIKGCRTVGIAGGAEKCARLTSEFGFDAAIDYRGRDLASLTAAIRAAAPGGVDIYFDNVGGVQLDAALDCLNVSGRVVTCGLISQYNSDAPMELRNLFKLVAKSARMEGFIVRSYADRFPAAAAELAEWVREGRIHFREEVVGNIEGVVPAFISLFAGGNQGKLIVRLDNKG